VIAGFETLVARVPDHFHMILEPTGNAAYDKDRYQNLPGLSVLIGGMWIANISYWGFNQYIIQRALAAKSIAEAQKGVTFAAYLKLLMPVILVVPGIAAVVLAPDLAKPDQAYPTMMRLLPPGLLGLVFAALVAAIVASMASKINSIATIFTLDLYAKMKHVKTRAEDGSDPDGRQMEKHLVLVGRTVAVVSIVIALIVVRPLLGKSDQAFQYIQEFTGFFTPGITVIFLLGLFWKRATEAGAIAAAVASVVLSFVYWFPAQYGGSAALNGVPFMHRMEIVFAASLVLAVICSLAFPARGDANRVTMEGVSFRTPAVFNAGAIGVILILVALYAAWW
jgi:SSS family solute:Na+ symporter